MDYYVSTTGSNGNDGLSWEFSWLTLRFAVPLLLPGDTLHVASGTYRGCTISAAFGAVQGTASSPITISGETGCLLDKRSLDQAGTQHWIIAGDAMSYWRFQGLGFDGAFNATSRGISLTGANVGVLVEDCFARTASFGFRIEGAGKCIVRRCDFLDITANPVFLGGFTIGVTDSIIEQCTTNNSGPITMHNDAATPTDKNNVIRRCLVINGTSYGAYHIGAATDLGGWVVENCITYNCSTGAEISLAAGATIRNNTFIAADVDQSQTGIFLNFAIGTRIFNNIIVADNASFIIYEPGSTGTLIDTGSQWTDTLDNPSINDNLAALFVSPTTQDYRLRFTAAARGIASATFQSRSAATEDFLGLPRLALDAGAYEYHPGPVTPSSAAVTSASPSSHAEMAATATSGAVKAASPGSRAVTVATVSSKANT